MTPYRPTPAAATRYRVTVNGETLEGERFVEIIKQLRERGYSTWVIEQVSAIVIAAHHPGVSARWLAPRRDGRDPDVLALWR